MKKLPKLNLHLPLIFSEKINTNKQVVVRTEEEINAYKKAVGYRKARVNVMVIFLQKKQDKLMELFFQYHI